MEHESGANIGLEARFDELESGIEAFKGTFETLLSTLMSLKHEALGDEEMRHSIRQRGPSVKYEPIRAQQHLKSDSALSTEVCLLEEGEMSFACSRGSRGSQGSDDEWLYKRSKTMMMCSPVLNELWGLEDTTELGEASQALTSMMKRSTTIISRRSSISKQLGLQILSSEQVKKGLWPRTLRVDWPRCLLSRHSKVGDAAHDEEAHMRNAIASMIAKSQELGRLDQSAFASAGSDASDHEPTNRVNMFVLTPTHPLRLCFDICSIVCLIYDMVTIPLFLAWNVEETSLIKAMQAAVMIFWTVDIFASFRTGYIRHGVVVTDPFLIAKRYLKGPFVIEFAIVAVDWIGFVAVAGAEGVTSSADTYKIMRLGKLSRMLRLMGVIRVAKVWEAFHRILDRNVSKGFVLALELAKLIVAIIYANHVLGCVWYALSYEISTDTGARWTDQLITGKGGRYEDTTSLFQYFTAFHWALTQMTPGSMQVSAQNSAERIFNVSCLLFGMLFFSSLISTLSAKMMSVGMLNAARNSQVSVMMRFLRERNVGSSMAFIIKRQVNERMQLKEPLRQQNVEALMLLSDRLQAELHMAICKPLISTYSIFVVVFRLARHHANQICFQATSFTARKGHDILFSAGGDCENAYVVSQGSLEYTQTPETAVVHETSTYRVNEGSWLSEACLWSEWIHVGTTECVTVVEVLEINAAQLLDATKKNLVLKMLLSHFGRAYHQHLVSLSFFNIPNDLYNDMLDNAHILSTMDKDFAVLISFVSLEILAETFSWPCIEQKALLLIEEVRMGQTTLIPRSQTQVKRCVHVSCIKMSNAVGHILVLLGEWDPSEKRLAVSFKLPATKIRGWESPDLALARLIKEDLPILEDFIILLGIDKEHEEERSSKYGIITEYTRNVFEAVLRHPESPDWEAETPITTLTAPPVGRLISGRSSITTSTFQSFPIRRSSRRVKRDFACYTFENQRHMHVYAWLPPETFEALKGAGNHSAAEQVMRDFNIAEAEVFSLDHMDFKFADLSI